MLPSGDEIHIYRLPLERTAPETDRLRAVLDDAETARADRISIERFRRRFICARGLMRVVLGHVLGKAPRELRFETNEHGKPSLAGAPVSLEFNLSHSGQMALLAITGERKVGVDIEQLRSNVDHETLARRHFRPEEAQALMALDSHRRAEAFLRAWTCKEAYVKARGLRLAPLLREVGVAIDPGAPAAYTRLPEDGHTWSLVMFAPAVRYVAAVCGEGASVSIRHFESPGF
jgi:4'-phosphopantetheinyl transferase